MSESDNFDRLAAMEKRWNDSVARQKETINRLMEDRFNILQYLNDDPEDLTPTQIAEKFNNVKKVLNGDLSGRKLSEL